MTINEMTIDIPELMNRKPALLRKGLTILIDASVPVIREWTVMLNNPVFVRNPDELFGGMVADLAALVALRQTAVVAMKYLDGEQIFAERQAMLMRHCANEGDRPRGSAEDRFYRAYRMFMEAQHIRSVHEYPCYRGTPAISMKFEIILQSLLNLRTGFEGWDDGDILWELDRATGWGTISWTTAANTVAECEEQL